MVERIALELGPWTWWVLGLVLLAAEIVVPGVFLIWIGIAAILVGVLSLMLWDAGLWSWQVQLLVFALLAVATTLVARRLMARDTTATDEPFLNRRADSLVGRTAVLGEPLAEGRGRIRLDDSVWIVEGPDLPAGTRVRVVSGKGPHLQVEPANL
ncbi:NfeD family protein [Ensifer soli]|uniref:NfeD family protein n=1 Tax=Ciceribacter sp. sgz301302 TaxID=3342379 RepID=UPI0035BADF13